MSSKQRVGAIVPVKTFSRAKTRLGMSSEKTEKICKIMLESVLGTLSQSEIIDRVVIVSKDETALGIGKTFDAIQIYDHEELGVNSAVKLADDYLLREGFDSTMVFPQDIPLIQVEDIDALLNFKIKNRCVLVVPSRKFDGTNALFRLPLDVMETHYDEDSYKIHLDTAEKRNAISSLILIRRIMLDVDDQSDLNLIMSYDLPISKSLSNAIL
ncbi:MAG: 2-phospho-L-lactate guanylyltransferase [Thaumarchaeota archaeon]|nr:2-phospho-L-lactate guanylyltransferase [Nitrososphaerota archaeon]MDE1872641.1 2-phospho-L-lactate guanylyltransferase [Nitrososphaerota archaeon]